MRLLITIQSLKDTAYNLPVNAKLQGLIYATLQNTPFSPLHDKNGYKFFCFSNIFPIGDIKKDDIRHILISSPNKGLLAQIKTGLLSKETLNIGEFQFKIKEIREIRPKLPNSFKIAAATPITIRIPENRYEEYGIQTAKKRYVFWRPEYSFEAFLKQLNENLFKKYNQYYNTKINEFPIFSEFVFKKSVANQIIENGREQLVIGSIWEFRFSHITQDQRKILEFGLECGFGERNSLGFGFVNVI